MKQNKNLNINKLKNLCKLCIILVFLMLKTILIFVSSKINLTKEHKIEFNQYVVVNCYNITKQLKLILINLYIYTVSY